MKNLALIATLGGLGLLSGCASITGTTNQPVSVETRAQGKLVAGANCKLNNDKGAWFITSPGSTIIHRSAEDLAVRCEKEGMQPGIVNAKSATKGMMFGNILFGGIIGAAVDASSGAAFDYPSMLTVEMGETARIEIPQQSSAATTCSAPAC